MNQTEIDALFFTPPGDSLAIESVTIMAGTQASGCGQVLAKITATGKYTQLNPNATDGTATPAAILVEGFGRLTADGKFRAITAGRADIRPDRLLFTSGMTVEQKGMAEAALAARGLCRNRGGAVHSSRNPF
jgi:hypothetical protein